jgi:hypothetical protein
MQFGKITLITPPDKLFNMNMSYLLVKPNNSIKEQFQSIFSKVIDDLNIFVYDNDDNDINWLLSVALQVDLVIIDIDNCDPITHKFVTLLLAKPNAYYLTNDETTPYSLINKNRIYNLDWIIDQVNNQEGDDNE